MHYFLQQPISCNLHKKDLQWHHCQDSETGEVSWFSLQAADWWRQVTDILPWLFVTCCWGHWQFFQLLLFFGIARYPERGGIYYVNRSFKRTMAERHKDTHKPTPERGRERSTCSHANCFFLLHDLNRLHELLVKNISPSNT